MEVVDEKLFSYIPTYEEVACILDSHPNSKINIANTKEPYDLIELEQLRVFGSEINGINLSLDTDDIEFIYAFSNIEHLRLSFTNTNYQISDFENFLFWVSESYSLSNIFLETVPENKYHNIEVLALNFALNKKMPVSLFLKNWKGKFAVDYRMDLDHLKMLTVSVVKKIELHKLGLQKQMLSTKPVKAIAPAELRYKGEVEVEDNEWELNVTTLMFQSKKEIIFRFEGKDESGTFTCEGRCEWKDLENGFYFVSRVPVNYREFPNGDQDFCSVKIRTITIDANGNCNFSGEWLQNHYTWKIEARLSKFK
jgi:hypothetical protein